MAPQPLTLARGLVNYVTGSVVHIIFPQSKHVMPIPFGVSHEQNGEGINGVR